MSLANTKVTNRNEHQEAWNLLPWYVNRSLDLVEQDFVKNHVKTCITCRIEINQQQRLLERMQQTDLLQQVSQDSFTKLRKRIEEQPKPCALAEHKKPKRALELHSRQLFGFVKYTALAASLLLLAMPFMLNSPTDKPELKGEYRTLANPTEGKQKNNIVRIVFADQPGPEQIEAILNNISGHIVKGPSKNEVYEVQIGNQQANPQGVNDAISHLRKNPLVVFADPAHELPSSD
jgi:hypothetical protein